MGDNGAARRDVGRPGAVKGTRRVQTRWQRTKGAGSQDSVVRMQRAGEDVD